MEYEGNDEHTCKSTLGFGITTRWIEMVMMMIVMMMMLMKVDAKASKIQAAAAVDPSRNSPSRSLPEVRFRGILVSL